MSIAGPQYEGRQYFLSWEGYGHLIEPVKPIDYARTEKLAAFYVGILDGEGKVLRFEKLYPKLEELGVEALPRHRHPGSVLYFEALLPGAAGAVWESRGTLVGREVAYADTEGAYEYVRGEVDTAGELVKLEKVVRTSPYREEYTYWPGGGVRGRVLTKIDGSVLRFGYDEAGTRVS